MSSTVDVQGPKIKSVSVSSKSGTDKTYAVGEKIRLSVKFDENVVVSGTPQLKLSLGGSEKMASYVGTKKGAALFDYVVEEGDSDQDGIGINANAFVLNGGGISDVSGNAALLTHASVAAGASHKVDGVAPQLASASIKGKKLVLDFDERLDAKSVASTGAFEVQVGGMAVGVKSVSVKADKVTLTLAKAATQGESVSLSYTDRTAGNDSKVIQDAVGNDLLDLSGIVVTNDTPEVAKKTINLNKYKSGDRLDASKGAFNYVLDMDKLEKFTGATGVISGFGSDDSISVQNTSTVYVIGKESMLSNARATFFSYDNSYVQITLTGVNPSHSSFSGVDEFNALPVGDIFVSA